MKSETAMIQQIPLGKQGFVTSEQGLGMMSVGITMGKRDLYGKKNNITKNGVDVPLDVDLGTGQNWLQAH